MAKKAQTEVVAANPRTSGIWELTDLDREAAAQLGIDLGASTEFSMARAAAAANEAALRAVEAGYLLLRVKSEADHGAFSEALDSIGMSSQRASEFMRMARFTSLLPEEKRTAIVAVGRSTVLALASADPQVIDMIVEEGVETIDALTVKEMRQKIRDMEADLADTAVQRDTAEAQVEALQKKLAKPGADREDKIPLVVADLRAEIVALAKKGGLTVDSFNSLGLDLMALIGTEEAHEWADATLRLGVAALCNLRLQLDGVIKKFLDQLPGEDPTPAERSYLAKGEVLEAAKTYQTLIAEHSYEKALREWEAEQARPREKGRPKAKPEAPKK